MRASIHDKTQCGYQHPAISSPRDESRCVHISEMIPLGDHINLLGRSSVQSRTSMENPEECVFITLAGAANGAYAWLNALNVPRPLISKLKPSPSAVENLILLLNSIF